MLPRKHRIKRRYDFSSSTVDKKAIIDGLFDEMSQRLDPDKEYCQDLYHRDGNVYLEWFLNDDY